MKDPQEVIKKVTFVVFAIVLLVCIAASFQYREQILGGYALRGSQTAFEERVKQAVDPAAVIEYVDSSERSAAITVRVSEALVADEAVRAQAIDDVWTAYAQTFVAGGMPIDRITLAAAGSSYSEGVGELAARTGVAAPPLHPMYAEKGYFDPSKEALPAADGADE